jgi:hypothetical protein
MAANFAKLSELLKRERLGIRIDVTYISVMSKRSPRSKLYEWRITRTFG